MSQLSLLEPLEIQKWRAEITVEGKAIYLGLHDTPELAHAAYVEAARQYFGEFARPQ